MSIGFKVKQLDANGSYPSYVFKQRIADTTVYKILHDDKVILFLVLPTAYGKPELYNSRSQLYQQHSHLSGFIESHKSLIQREDTVDDINLRSYVVAGGKLLGYLIITTCSTVFFNYVDQSFDDGTFDPKHRNLVYTGNDYFQHPGAVYRKLESEINIFCYSDN